MPLSQEPPDFRFVPSAVASDGRVTVNGQVLSSSFYLTPEALVEGWAPATAASMEPTHLDAILALAPTVILLGSGPRLVFPATAVMAAALTRGIGIEVMDNAAAARTFAVLASEGRRVVAAFLVPPSA